MVHSISMEMIVEWEVAIFWLEPRFICIITALQEPESIS
jgi:hypothetical protein